MSQLLSRLEALVAPTPAIIQWTKTYLRDSHKEESVLHSANVQRLNKRHEQLQKNLDRLYTDRYEGIIDEARFEQHFKSITNERDEIVESLARLNRANTDYIERGVDILELTQTAAERFMRLDTQDKQLLIRKIFSNLVLDEHTLLTEYTREAGFVFDKVERTREALSIFEPLKKASIKAKSEALNTAKDVWCTRRDSNLRPSAPQADALSN
jgi:HPt (histidine-containing phosphotransfer) domain-containing protein